MRIQLITHTAQIGDVCVGDRYAYSSIRIQLYAEDMYDTYAYSYFDYIYRNLVMQSSRLDYNRTLLLLIGEAFIMLSYILECVRSLLKECDIVFIDE